MKRFLIPAGAIALMVGFTMAQEARQRDTRPGKAAPRGGPLQFGAKGKAFPAQPDQKDFQPFGPNFDERRSSAVARRALPQRQEDLELIEAQRDIRKAHVRAAEVAVRAAETQFEFIDKAGNVPQLERAKARLDVEAARAQLEIKMAEMKEVEVRVKYARKRLEDAKAAATPPPARPEPVDPPPPPGDFRQGETAPEGEPAPIEVDEKLIAALRADLEKRMAEAKKQVDVIKEAEGHVKSFEDDAKKATDPEKRKEAQEKAEAARRIVKLEREKARRIDNEISMLKAKLKQAEKN